MVGQRAVLAQSYTADARKIGMGGVGDNSNIAISMVAPAEAYTVIPVPLGLFQVLQDFDKFNPSSDQFDPVRAVENASSPLHYTIGRQEEGVDHPDQRFIADLVNGRLNRDLSTYRTFKLPATLSAEGLASPVFGKTIKFAQQSNGDFQGVYVGAGPYLSFGTSVAVDSRLIDILGSETAKYYPNTSFQILDEAAVQLAMSITFGYRARLRFPGEFASSEPTRDGIYVAANYRHLKGFKYLDPDTIVRFDTNAQGLISLLPTTAPLTITNIEGSSGSGRAIDMGVAVVRNRWEVGFGVNGIGNKIDWSELELKRFTLTSLVQGSDFVEQTLPPPGGEVTVELPVVTSGSFGFDAGDWAFAADALHGYNGNSFHGGVERRFGLAAVRGGARYSRERWDPTYGVGFGRRVAVDVAVFGTHSNLQDKRQTAIAVSLRINQPE
jgi:hypothetical protein